MHLVFEVEVVFHWYSPFPLKDGPVITAIAEFIYKNEFKNLAYLNQLVEPLLAARSNIPENNPTQINPQQLLNAEILEKEISPWIREIRKGIFGDEKTPFPSWDAALKWLKQLRGGIDTGETITIDTLKTDVIRKFLSDVIVTDESGKPFSGGIETVFIEGMGFKSNTPPAVIYSKTKDIAEQTAINHVSLIMHVLTNTKIVCDKWDFTSGEIGRKLPSGRITKVNNVTIRFVGNLNFEDMRQIYGEIRDRFQYRKLKQIKAKHLELYKLVNEGQIPLRKGKVAFWKQIAEEWNRKHPEAKYYTWKGVNVAYNRILKNVDRHFRPSPTENTKDRIALGNST